MAKKKTRIYTCPDCGRTLMVEEQSDSWARNCLGGPVDGHERTKMTKRTE